MELILILVAGGLLAVSAGSIGAREEREPIRIRVEDDRRKRR